MPNPSLSPWKTNLQVAEITVVAPHSRRAGRGSLWSLPRGVFQRQPQDGAFELRASAVSIAVGRSGDLLREPEDAGLTGGKRSLMRRLMGLNILSGLRPERKATKPALLDDSFTQAA